ncbi:IS1595 family transposase [Mesorhizobium sp. M1322]|uniref:IS1595 family transposase n=1 Tax=Mesorhizobium sp. M1322 TaxID=2957081 RepID=UPI00333AFFD5
MIKSIVDIAPLLANEMKAGDFIRDIRWPNGVQCAHCNHGVVYELKGPNSERRQWKCADCRKKFSVTTKSIFEGSHVSLGKWAYAFFIMCSAKKGVSANQLKRELGISYKAAWFVCHRVRYAMMQEPFASMLGKDRGVVELDETFVGGKVANNKHKDRTERAGKKEIVMTMIERDGNVKTAHVPDTKKKTLQALAKPVVDKSATIMTDSNLSYEGLNGHFYSHHSVDHSKEYVRSWFIHTNFAESYHSLLKRGIFGSFHQVSAKHLARYLSEFDYRWNTRHMSDGQRTEGALGAVTGRRLMYRKGANSLI